jgi:hypothetical protein
LPVKTKVSRCLAARAEPQSRGMPNLVMRLDPRTKDYVAKRTAMGHTKLEAIRMLKRYIAHEVFGIIRTRQKEINRPPAAAA